MTFHEWWSVHQYLDALDDVEVERSRLQNLESEARARAREKITALS